MESKEMCNEIDKNEPRREMKGPFNSNKKEGVDSCDEIEKNEPPHEIKDPLNSNINKEVSKMFNPEIMKKLQNNPKFIEMMKKQEEENKIQNMDPREKLRARLRQKRNKRMSARTKEAEAEANAQEETPVKQTRKPKKPRKPIQSSIVSEET